MPTKQTGEPKAAVSKVRGFLEALGRWPFDLLTSLARRLWRSGLWLPACLLVATALVIWGFARLNGFASNAVAEAAGILISIPVTVLIVEAILDRRRDRQWAQVREQTASRTGPLPKDAASEVHSGLRAEDSRRIPHPWTTHRGELPTGLRAIAAALRAREDEPEPDPAMIGLLRPGAAAALPACGDGRPHVRQRRP